MRAFTASPARHAQLAPAAQSATRLDTPPTWSCHPYRELFGGLAEPWDSLNRRFIHNHPMGDTRFLVPLLTNFATADTLCAVSMVDNRYEGMVLLNLARLGVAETFCPSQTELCPVLVSSMASLRGLFAALPWSTMALVLYRQDPDYSLLPGPATSLCYEVDHHVTTVAIDLAGEFSAYWQARPAKLRKNVERAFRHLEGREGGWRFTTVESPDAIADAVIRYGELESTGWKGRSGTALHPANRQGSFYLDVLQGFAQGGQGIVYELYAGEQLVSSQLAISNGIIVITLKTTHDEAFRRYSPGRLLDYLTVRHEFTLKRFRRIEFCTNAGLDLVRWGTTTRPVSHITVYRSPFARKVVHLSRQLKRWMDRLREQSRRAFASHR